MLRVVLAVLIALQPMLLAECAALAAAPTCASPCGEQHSSQPTEKSSPCCKLGPQKLDPQAVKTATVELRVNDSAAAIAVAGDWVPAPSVRATVRFQADPTDLLHKRPLSEVLCILLV